jgi:hypothetical protein
VDIADWLTGLGLTQYTTAFRENDITDLLPELTAEDLKDLGVGSVGHRRTLLKAIAALRGDPPQSVAEPAPAAAAPAEAERRQLTVVFCDLRLATATRRST